MLPEKQVFLPAQHFSPSRGLHLFGQKKCSSSSSRKVLRSSKHQREKSECITQKLLRVPLKHPAAYAWRHWWLTIFSTNPSHCNMLYRVQASSLRDWTAQAGQKKLTKVNRPRTRKNLLARKRFVLKRRERERRWATFQALFDCTDGLSIV